MPLRLHLVGGLGVFGQNCMVIEDAETGDAVVVDAGIGFPREAGLAAELCITDPTFIREYQGRLKGYLLTHGHEDHIGAVGYLHREVAAPCLGTPLTLELVRERCDDVGLPIPEVQPLTPGATVQLGAFHVSALSVSHSIPDSLCLLLEAGGLRVLHSGDFRIDENPVLGPPTDMSGLSSLGSQGVDLLLADSTGAMSHGHNAGERSVGPALERIFAQAHGRVFLSTFASHLQRMALVAQLSERNGRKILVAGRGAQTHARLGRTFGNAVWPESIMVSPGEAQELPPQRLTVMVSGCQGEERSAFWRLAHGEGNLPPVQKGDDVIHSARAIPGNEGRLAGLLDNFARMGATVHDAHEGVHVSGHGYREDLRRLIQAVRPRAVLAVHGGFRHLQALAELAREEGLAPEMTPVCTSGDVVEVDHGLPPRLLARREVGNVLLDEQGGMTPLGPVVDERRDLTAGLVVLSAVLDAHSGEVVGRLQLSSRGLGLAAQELLEGEAVHEALVSLNALQPEERTDQETAQAALQRGVKRVLRRLPGRPPVVVAHALLR
ncbi:MAG: ribonuclease J [Myxococcota bacterium]